ncbi:unnamed protein product [Diamesa hyperborea]
MAQPVKLKYDQINADDPRFRIKPYQQIASGVTGALITSLFMTPLDVVKTRIQVQQKSMFSNKCYLFCNGLMEHLCPCGPNGEVNKTARFTGTFDAFSKISRNEGIRSLWSGLGPTLVLALPTTVLYFVAYEQIRVRLKDYHSSKIPKTDAYQLPMWIPLIAGCTARCFAVTVVNPLELIRTKMQSERMSYSEVGRAFKVMINKHGLLGLYKGLLPTILRDAPFSSIYWTSYETFKRINNITQPTFRDSFIGGAISGSLAAFCTTPFDVIKTHQQIEFGEKVMYSNNGNGKRMSSTKQTIINIFKNSGIKGYYAGLTPRLFKVTPACAIMISSFEYGKTFFYERNLQRFSDTNHSANEFNVAENL